MNPFSRRALAIIFGVGLTTFVLGLVLTAFSAEIFDLTSFHADSFSYSLVGHRAFAELLGESGLVVVTRRNKRVLQARERFPLLVLEPPPPGVLPLLHTDRSAEEEREEEDLLQLLLDRAADAGVPVLLALPKWIPTPDFRHPGWISSRRLRELDELERVIRVALGSGSSASVLRPGALRHVQAHALGVQTPELDLGEEAQLFSRSAGLEPLVWCEQGVLIGRARKGLILISDPTLFNNQGLGRGDHAELMMALLVDLLSAEGVVIDETLHGYERDNSLLAQAMRFPLAVVTIHAVLAALLAAWWLASRFGKPLPPPPELPPGKRLLLDNTAELLHSAGDHADTLRRYLKVTMISLARRFSVPEGTSERELVPRLQSLSRARGVEIDLKQIESRASSPTLKPQEALRLARKIHSWRNMLTDTR
ncbi:MAG: hypothetical protein JXR96_06365 [Deltaproteobacteria bacterium]|nr:hypothetical protein [Deltaproteobacteria bacterium]